MFFVCWESKPKNNHEKWLKDVWNSNRKRFKVPRFRCHFCGNIFKGSSYSIVDGGQSCIKCDEKDNF